MCSSFEATNDRINEFNARTLPVLSAITGQDLGPEPEKWKGWWTDQLGYAYQVQRARDEADLFRLRQRRRFLYAFGLLRRRYAGPNGRRPADRSNRSGLATGSCRRDLDRNARVPAGGRHASNSVRPTLRITIGDETIVATGIHRFWKAGKGWAMARELKAGDRLRIARRHEHDRIDRRRSKPTGLQSRCRRESRLFRRESGLLVHDFSFVQPVLEPFDRQGSRRQPSGPRVNVKNRLTISRRRSAIVPDYAKNSTSGPWRAHLSRPEPIGREKARLFGNNADFEAFERIMIEAHQRHPIPILAYALLPNPLALRRLAPERRPIDRFLPVARTHPRDAPEAFAPEDGKRPALPGSIQELPDPARRESVDGITIRRADALSAGLVEKAQLWRFGSLWARKNGDRAIKSLLAPWPVERPANWTARVNAPLFQQELDAFKSASSEAARSAPTTGSAHDQPFRPGTHHSSGRPAAEAGPSGLPGERFEKRPAIPSTFQNHGWPRFGTEDPARARQDTST